jgi:ribose transport system ATP-binding protein
MSEAATILLSLNDVSKSFPGVKALDRVSLQLRSGEVHGLVGENGAGKSTLMGIACGGLLAGEGTVLLDGYEVRGDPEAVKEHGLSIVRQEPLLMPDLMVAENIYLGLPAALRPPIHEMKAFAEKALLRWSAETNINVADRVETLNPEKRFIVEIVRALAGDVKVLVLDEPTEHLVAEDVERLFVRIREIVKRGSAVIYISHRLKEVQTIADRLTVLRDGKTLGTFEARGLVEDDIVTMIVGATVDAEFPPKTSNNRSATQVLNVSGYSGQGFHNVALSLKAGEIVGLAGIDANGQREFLRSLAGLNKGSGKVSVNGEPIVIAGAPSAVRAGFSYLPNDRHREGIVAGLGVRENFSLRSLVDDSVGIVLSRSSESSRAAAAVARFAVKTPTLDTPIEYLSGGNQQKLILSSVLASNPKVLLVDEPTQGVDVGARAEIYKILRQIAEAGIGILVVSSDATEVAGLCDRVMVFSRGAIVAQLSGDEVSENHITATVLKATSVRDRPSGGAKAFVAWAAGDLAPIVTLLIAILAMGVVASVVSPFYLSPRSLSGMMTLVSTLALVAYGQQLLMLVGGIDLSVGPLMGLVGVVGSFFLLTGAGEGAYALGWAAILLTAIGVGALNFVLIEVIRLHPLIATLATYMGLQAVSLILRPEPGGMIDLAILDFIGLKIAFMPLAFIFAAIVGFALEYVLFKNPLGIFLRGHGSNAEAARHSGVTPFRMRLIAYVGCSLLTGLAGVVMIGQVGVGDPLAGVDYTLTSIAAAVIGGASLFGGRGSFVGALFGAIFIAQVNQVTAFVRLDPAWSSYLLGVMILGSVTLYSTSRRQVRAA